MYLWKLPLRSFQTGSSAGAEWLHFSTLPVDLSSRFVHTCLFVVQNFGLVEKLDRNGTQVQKSNSLSSTKCLQALVTRVPDIIRTIISWTLDYLREHVINWIREQGGWVKKSPWDKFVCMIFPLFFLAMLNLLWLLSLTFRRAYVPTLAHPLGRPLAFSWRAFLPPFLSSVRCERWPRMRSRRDQRKHHWRQGLPQCQKKINRKIGRAWRRFGRKRGLNKLHLDNFCVYIICHLPLLRIENWTVHINGECINLMPLFE